MNTQLLLNCRRLFLRGLTVQAHIGVHDFEQAQAQRVVIDVDLYVSFEGSSPKDDRIDEVVDYDFIRAVIRARRRAVADIYADPAAAAAVIAPEYKLDVAVTREILERLVASGKDSGVPYWGPGDIRYGPMDEMIKAQQDIGALRDRKSTRLNSSHT